MSGPKFPNVKNIGLHHENIKPNIKPDVYGRLLALNTCDLETYDIHFVENGKQKMISISTNQIVIMLGAENAENSGQSDDHGSG